MKKARRIVTLMLSCAMLLGATLSASAASFPYNKGPCPSCSYPNSGEFQSSSGCDATYKCGRCGTVFYYCDANGQIYK